VANGQAGAWPARPQQGATFDRVGQIRAPTQ